MFGLSKNEVRRLLKGGALRGYFGEKPTWKEIEEETTDAKWDFSAIQLGKYNLGGVSIPRDGFIVHSQRLREILNSSEG